MRGPVLVVHGEEDASSPPRRGQALAEATGGGLLAMEGSGHVPQARDPVRTNLLLRDFTERVAPAEGADDALEPGAAAAARPVPLLADRAGPRPPRPRGRARAASAGPDLEVDWLTQHPVTAVPQAEGERIHPASAELASESDHIERESADHDLHAFQAIRRMDEILMANFMVFHEVASGGDYDLMVGDEAWDVDYFWHENPELKRTAFAWMTGFVGWVPMPEGGGREAFLTADYNAEMIEQVARFPRVRDRVVFVGNPTTSSRWTSALGCRGSATGRKITTPSPATSPASTPPPSATGRSCASGSATGPTSGGGGHRRRLRGGAVAAAAGGRRLPEAARRVDGLRMIAVAGPRIDPARWRRPPRSRWPATSPTCTGTWPPATWRWCRAG